MKTVLIAVVSLDGCITRHDRPGAQGWASPEDQAHFRSVTRVCDVRVFGSGTYVPDRDMFIATTQGSSEHVRRIVMTRRVHEFESDAVAGRLEFTSDAPTELVERLRADGHNRCALLGGGSLYGAFLRDDLVDEIELTIEPVIFGSGIRLAGEVPFERRFRLAHMSTLNDSTMLVRYERA